MYKAIIFDFFDVIRTDAYKTWLNLHNYRLEGDFLEVVQRMDRGEILLDAFLSRLSEITGQPPEDIFDEMERGAAVDQQVLDIISRLRSRYKVGLLSNAPSSFLRSLLADHDLEKHFDTIIISSEVGMIKPHPEIFQHILDEMGVKPHEAVFIDDNPKNVAGGEAVGIQGVVYTDPASLRAQLSVLEISF